MKLTFFLLLITFAQVFAKVNAQQISLSEKNTSTIAILNQIQRQSGYDIFYKNHIVKDLKITVQLNNVSIETALKAVLGNQDLEFSIDDKIITIKQAEKGGLPVSPKPPFVKIKGIVVDEEGKYLPGATINVLGKNTLGLTSGPDGTFAFESGPGDTTIRVSFVGYRTTKVKIEPGKTNYRIVLLTADARLKDVVVTGIFDKPKESFTGAVTTITKDQIKLYGNRNLLKTIGNIDPSFDIQERNSFGSDPNVLPDIEIRGSTTLANINDLQSNVRNTLNLPLFILDGFEVSLQRVYDMNQADVESVVILKDASSTAMYGARGANGVVVITSIKPKAGQLRVSYAGGLNLELPDLSSYNLLNARQKLELEKSYGLYTNSSPYTQNTLSALYNKNLKSVQEGVNTNWAQIPVQNGIGQYHSLNLSGGDSQFRYIMNGSYNQITGAMIGSKRNNFNGSMTIMYLMSKVKFNNNLSVGFENSGASNYGDYSNFIKMNPYWNPYNADGTPVLNFDDFSGTGGQANPAYNGSLKDFNKTQYTVVRNTTSIDWDIFKTLKWTNSIGFSKQVGATDVFKSPSNPDFNQVTNVTLKGSYTKTNALAQSYQFRSNLSYGQVFGKNSVYVGANAQMLEDKGNSNTVIVTGFINDTQNDISLGAAYSGNQPSTTESTVRSVGLSTTMNYNYDGRYFADASYSTQGGSSFGSNSRFGSFYSVGAGWTISNEKFLKDKFAFLNLLRVRYNYGVTGGINFSPDQALTTYTYDRTASYRTLIGTSLTALGNPDLQWQNSYQNNYGIDISLFNGRVSLSANYYRKNTPNTITQATLPYSNGFTSYTENLGEVNNYGTDINASVYIIRNNASRFSWSVQAAASNNRNVLVHLSDALKKANALAAANSNSTSGTSYEYVEGKSIDEVYVLKSPGVDPATGDVLYQRADGTITKSIAGLEKIAVGSSQPKVNARFSTTVRYGAFVANIGFAGRFGGKKLNQTLLSQVDNAFIRSNVDVRVLTNHWQKPGDIVPYRYLLSPNATYANDRFVFTENTVMLNNVNIAYELPMNWVKRLNMQRIGISASMSDIFYWSNIDQQRGTNYPYTFKPSFSLSGTF